MRRHFGYRRAASITTADVRRFIAMRQEQKASTGEINRELAALKRAFSLAIRSTPPRILIKPYIPMLQENNVRKGFFESDQFEAVLKRVKDYLQAMMRFFYLTGWRRSEVQKLQWSQVDFESGWIYLEAGTTKNQEARKWPMTSELRDVLEGQRRDTDEVQKKRGIICPWVFHNVGKPIKSYYTNWRTACTKAGLPGRIVHDFRRTAVRNLVRAGVPERVAMQMTGHKTRSVFERYNIVSERDLKHAAQLLENAMVTVSVTVGHPSQTATPVNPLESIARP